MKVSALSRVFQAVVERPVAMTMVCIAALVFGLVSFQRLGVELMPNLSYPTITVRTPFEGAAPEEVETQISRLLESRLATLNGLASMESRSRANQSDVVLGFEWGTDMSDAAQSVRESLQTVFLPEGVERPMILRYDPSLDPFLRVALSADIQQSGDASETLFLLRDVAEREIKRELESLPGVAAVQVRGGLEREIQVRIREDWMAARKISLGEIQSTLSSENVNLAGGSIIEGNREYLIRTLNEFESVETIRALKIRRADGVLVPLLDVATVNSANRDREVYSFLNGDPAVELEVYKEADANIVEVAETVKYRLLSDGLTEEMRSLMNVAPPIEDTLPDSFSMALLDDQAAFIEASVSNLRNTVLLGGLLAVLVLYLFLRNLRSTIIIGLAIPISVVLAFGPLFVYGVSLNLMSLGGLALGVGMLVDNGVVVLESIQRYLDDGVEKRPAAVRGASDVAAAVTTSTLTTVAVFFPLTFVEGVAGELFGDLAIAVVASLIASLLVAIFLVPMLAALGVGSASDGQSIVPPDHSWSRVRTEFKGMIQQWRLSRSTTTMGTLFWGLRTPYVWFRLVLSISLIFLWITAARTFLAMARFVRWIGRPVVVVVSWPVRQAANVFDDLYTAIERRYMRRLPGLLSRPGLVLGVAALITLCALGMGRYLGTELIPSLHQGRFTVETSFPVGTPIHTTVNEIQRIQPMFHQHPDITSVYATVGADQRADSSSEEGEHTARIRIQLKQGGDMVSRENRVMDELRTRLDTESRMATNFVRPALFSFKTPVELVIYGFELTELEQASTMAVERLESIPELRDVRSSLGKGYPELRVHYDRIRLKRYGLDTFSVATRVRNRIQGVEATRLQWADQKVDVRLQLVKQQRETVGDLRALNVNPELIPVIPLDAIATIEEGYGPSEIRRVDQQRAVVISANTVGFDLGSASSQINEVMRNLAFPEGVVLEVAGQAKEMSRSMRSLWYALLLAVFLVYVIMASSFESVIHPFVILFSVPLAMVGVVASLWLTGIALSAVVAIGAIVLSGVVVNNAIVLVDTINRLRPTMGLDAAVAEATRLRMRPILMTTMTTVLGLFPLAVGPLLLGVLPGSWSLAEGAEIQQPLAVTVIGGLVSSTLLTLLIIPVLYRVLTGLRKGQA